MTIAVGEKIRLGTFRHIPYDSVFDDLATCPAGDLITDYVLTEKWVGKKVVLFAVPGAFTPTCHVKHLPGYLQHYDEFKQKGVDIIAVIATNDPFVLSGWARVEGLKDKIVALTDTNAKWSESLGLSIDLSVAGLGIRTKRYALVLDDLVVKHIQIEESPGNLEKTGAKHVLALL